MDAYRYDPVLMVPLGLEITMTIDGVSKCMLPAHS